MVKETFENKDLDFDELDNIEGDLSRIVAELEIPHIHFGLYSRTPYHTKIFNSIPK